MANKQLSAIITIGGAISGSLKSALGSTRSGLEQIGATARKLEREQRMLGKSIQELGKAGLPVDSLRARYLSLTDQIAKARREQQKIGAAHAGMAKGKAMMGSAGMALGIAGLALAPALSAAKNSAEFEYQLRMIGNTANMTDAEIKRLGETIIEAGRKSAQSTDEMTKAMGFLVAAGMDVKTASELLDQIGRAATASGAEIEDLSKAAFVLTDTLKIKPGAEMAAALDTLAQAGKEGNVELKDMAKQLPVLGAGFVSLKMNGREAAATMAAGLEIARKGAADADEAANNMKNFIAKIMSPETLKKAKKNFNIDLYKIIQDAQKTGKNPFEASMQAIMKATKGDQKAIGDLFGDMQVQNFIRPMIQNWEEYKRIKDKSLAASGVIDTDFSSVTKTSKIQMEQFANSVDRAGKAFGEILLPALGRALSALTQIISGVADFVTNNKELVGNLLTVTSTLGGFFLISKTATMGIGLVTFAFNALKIALMTNPIGLAITLLATAALLIYQNWEPIKGFFSGLWDSIVSGAKVAFEWVIGKLEWVTGKVKNALSVFAGLATGDFGGAWGAVKQFYGVGSDSPGQSAPAPKAPPVPAMAQGRGAAGNSSTQNNTFNITQQPGQDSKALADDIMRRMKEKEAVQRRGRMHDPAMGY